MKKQKNYIQLSLFQEEEKWVRPAWWPFDVPYSDKSFDWDRQRIKNIKKSKNAIPNSSSN